MSRSVLFDEPVSDQSSADVAPVIDVVGPDSSDQQRERHRRQEFGTGLSKAQSRAGALMARVQIEQRPKGDGCNIETLRVPADTYFARQLHNSTVGLDPLSTWETGLTASNTDNEFVDVVVQNQRGWFLIGYPFFSAKSLLPFDPSEWTSKSGHNLSVSITDLVPPDDTWEWAWRRWYVDMSGDVDDQGWCYSWRFGSQHWHGTHIWFRSFVRRRTWKRLRRRVVRIQPVPPTTDERLAKKNIVQVRSLQHLRGERSSSEWAQTPEAARLLDEMREARIDRERVALLVDRLADPDMEPLLPRIYADIGLILDSFDFSESVDHFLARLQRVD